MKENVNCYYNENGKELMQLIQEWVNENSRFWGCNVIQNNDNLES